MCEKYLRSTWPFEGLISILLLYHSNKIKFSLKQVDFALAGLAQ